MQFAERTVFFLRWHINLKNEKSYQRVFSQIEKPGGVSSQTGRKSVPLLCLESRLISFPRAGAVRKEAKALNAKFERVIVTSIFKVRSVTVIVSLHGIFNDIIPTLWTQKHTSLNAREDVKMGNQKWQRRREKKKKRRRFLDYHFGRGNASWRRVKR